MTTTSNKKTSSFLFNFYIFLGALQLAIIIFWVLALGVWLPRLSETSAVGANLLLGLTFPWFLMFACVLAIITLIGLSIYMFRHRPKGKKRILGFIALAISLIPVSFLVYQRLILIPAENRRFEQYVEQIEQEERERELQLEREIEEVRQYRENYQGEQ